MPLTETIKALVSFILKGVDLRDCTSIFVFHSINHNVFIYNVFKFMIRSNRKLFRIFPTSVTLALRYTLFYKIVVYKKVVLDWPKP